MSIKSFKTKVRRVTSALCAFVLALTTCLSVAEPTLVNVKAETTGSTVWIVGDSTVSAFNDSYYYPRYGWGTKIGDYLDGSYNIENIAASGTSSLSYKQNSGYEKLKSGIKSGDVLIIGFGHNDEKLEVERYTNPNGDYKTAGSFANSLYENYIKPAQAAGATVILCTPIVRRTASGTWSNNDLHKPAGDSKFPGGDYAEAIRKLGSDLNIPVVDMTEKTKALYDSLTPSETVNLHAWVNSKPESVDNTHTNVYGAKYNAWLITQEIKKQNVPGISAHIKTEAAPTKAATLVSNPDYKDVPYSPPTKGSTNFNDADIFKGTAFGELGGTPTTANYQLGKNSDGSIHMAVLNNKGKITATSDGIAMYYYQIPSDSSFSISADVTVNSFDANSQVSFGLMARDNMFIDTNDKTLIGDYVAAAPLLLNQTSGQYCCFARRSGVLTQNTSKTTLNNSIEAGKTYKLNITSNSDGYTCSIDDQAVSDGFDFSLKGVDSEYIYVGMFAARKVDVTFSNVRLVVDDELVYGKEEVKYLNKTTSINPGTVNYSKEYAQWDNMEGKDLLLGTDGEVSLSAAKYHGTSYGVQVPAGTTMKINLAKGFDAKIAFQGSNYSTAGKIKVSSTDAAGSFDSDEYDTKTANDKDDIVINYAGKNDATLTLEFDAATYIGPMTITLTEAKGEVKPEIAVAKKFDVWDFGAALETDADKYNNIITAQTWNGANIIGSTGAFTAGGSYKFGDLTLFYNSNDRLYSSNADITNKNAASGYAAYSLYKYSDGYNAGGLYYANGTGGASRRYVTIDNLKAGDTIRAYMGSSSGDTKAYFGNDTQGVAVPLGLSIYDFVVDKDGSYKLYFDGAAGKPIINRIVKIPGVVVNGKINLAGNSISDYTVSFVSEKTGKTYDAIVSGNDYSVSLPVNDTYIASLRGVAGYGFTNATKFITVETNDAFTGLTGKDIVVEQKQTYTLTGKLTGFAADYDTSKLAIKLVADASSMAENVDLTINADKTFSATLMPEVEYTATLSGVNDYEIISGGKINNKENTTADITVAAKATYKASGAFKDLTAGTSVTSLVFENVDDKYSYTAKVTGNGYEVNLRDGAYLAKATVDGFTTSTHVVVAGKDVTKDLLFVSTKAKDAIAKKSDIYVGYPDKADNYDTVRAAVEAASLMKPASESERVTIHIAPGTYREQVIVTTPYISFVNDTDKQVLLTWYYGIGYKYYSADKTGYYNPENAYDQYDKAIAARWGAAVYVKSSAKYFRADGITFENSFNRYLTDEELEDGVELDPGSDKNTVLKRQIGAVVTSKAATERACALAVEGDGSEFNNCSFLSSQDTLFTQEAGKYYFKNCTIEGQTDYIFGGGSAVFDGCKLMWAGYSAGSTAGYITAHRPKSGTQEGYLFRNCSVVSGEYTVTPGYFGRPWGADARVTLLNTKLESAAMINGEGWTKMSSADPKDANYFEYNTTLFDGTAANVSSRVRPQMTKAEADAVSVNTYFGSWKPYYYVDEDAKVEFATAPFIVSNGDINTPYPGNTFTVGYSLGDKNNANDNSKIEWYLDGELVKTSFATVDKTFKAPKDATGKKLLVKVTPMTISGLVGENKGAEVEQLFREGYEDPSAQGGNIIIGDGINIYLAGDSTVKDYSANGMNSSNATRDEGAWGEFIQAFFNQDAVKIQNYANGGRSARNFINEGSLDKIVQNIKEGDYLFIQFGHNDCSDDAGYIVDRYCPLGTPDANGIYPVTAGTKVSTAGTGLEKYGSTFYSYDCGGTYKWYLKQYIDAARAKGAIPVLVTPVARTYFDADGKIRPHHDASSSTNKTNSYVTAVKQLGEEENVLVIDAFDITSKLYEAAYKADPKAGNKASEFVKQVMYQGDSTHNNKLGGMLIAGLIAKEIQGSDLDIAKSVIAPTKTAGINMDSQQIFVIDSKSKLTAYVQDENKQFSIVSEYWTGIGQGIIDDIAKAVPGQQVGAGAGDANGDGKIDSVDAVMVKQYLAGYELSNKIDANMDANGDGKIDSIDAVMLMQYLAGYDVKLGKN